VITQARFGLRLQRFEVLAVAIAAMIVGLSAIIVRWRLDSIGVPMSCWDEWFSASGPLNESTCSGLAGSFLGINEEEGGKVMAAMAILPLFAGLFLGVPVVAREIEGGTAATAWALAGSRARWLAGRLAPLIVLIVISLAFLAVASERLWQGREPWGVFPNFRDVGLHGPGLIARGIATLGLALLAGAILGRVLPAVIVGVVLCFVLFVGWQMAFAVWGQAAAEVVPMSNANENMEEEFPGGTSMSQGVLTPGGRFIYDWEAVELAPQGVDPYEWLFGEAVDDGYMPVMRGIPGTAYAQWALIETVGFGAIGLASIALAFPVVDRRRPLR
jgi:ABC-type transport system involved in multi-copper enzyme maturation permease subunit